MFSGVWQCLSTELQSILPLWTLSYYPIWEHLDCAELRTSTFCFQQNGLWFYHTNNPSIDVQWIECCSEVTFRVAFTFAWHWTKTRPTKEKAPTTITALTTATTSTAIWITSDTSVVAPSFQPWSVPQGLPKVADCCFWHRTPCLHASLVSTMIDRTKPLGEEVTSSIKSLPMGLCRCASVKIS